MMSTYGSNATAFAPAAAGIAEPAAYADDESAAQSTAAIRIRFITRSNRRVPSGVNDGSRTRDLRNHNPAL